jgi:hypothetical protein
MGFPFVTLAAQLDRDIFLTDKQYLIRRMRGVTGCTVALPDGFTKTFVFGIVYRPLLELDRIGMAAAANLELGVHQKLFFS